MAEKKTESKKNIRKPTPKEKKSRGAAHVSYQLPEGFHKAVPIILFASAIFTGICFIIGDIGAFGNFLSNFLLGMFSYGAYSIPVLMILHAIFYASDLSEKRLLSRVIFSLVAVTSLAALAYVITYWGYETEFHGLEYYSKGIAHIGGGLIGSIVAYLLVQLFGYIGLIIIALAVLAIYITFFFSKGERTLGKIAYNILKGLITLCAYVERKIKNMYALSKSKKNEKQKKINEQKNKELYDDEFFDVDNGIERLEISELGIKETRSSESIEANPTLHEKVFHKSAVGDDEPKRAKSADADRAAPETADDSFIPKKRVVNSGFGFDDGIYSSSVSQGAPAGKDDIIIESYTDKAAKPMGDGSSADDIFTQDFDPFGMMMSDELANKPSSRSLLDETPTIKEDISELTEEDIERAKRIAEFERRKAQIVGKSKATPVTNTGEFTGTPKTVEFTEIKQEEVKTVTEEDSSFSVKIEKNEQTVGTYSDFTQSAADSAVGGYKEEEETVKLYRSTADYQAYTQERTVSESPVSTEPVRSESTERPAPDTRYENAYRRAAELTRASLGANQEKYGANRQAEPIARTEAPVYEARSYNQSSYTPKAPSYTPEFKPYEVKDVTEEKDGGLVFEFDTDGTLSFENNTELKEEAKTLTVERTMLTDTAPQEYTERESVSKVEEYSAPDEYSAPKEDELTVNETAQQYYSDTENDENRGSDTPEEAADTDNPYSGYDSAPVTDEYSNEDDEGDDEVIEPASTDEYSDGEDEISDEEEIPPEERNPKVSEYRDMFTMFRDNDSDSDEEESEESGEYTADSETEEQTEDGYSLPDDGADSSDDGEFAFDGEDEEYSDTDTDEPPFDTDSEGGNLGGDALDGLVAKPREEKPEKKKADYSHYVMPPIDLLGLDEVQDDEEINAEINQNTNTLIETLASFNVTASIKGVDRGPRITRYEVVPARGVKVNAITNLFDDIALNLAAEGIRMEAPIPGKSAIGFEIPNKRPSNVRLRELLECEEFSSARSKTIVCIGKDVAGNPVFGDIAKFPHALVAGATGMGKSVCINSIMISMLYKARPDEVKFIMIDPKKVEFRMYSGIPHLLIPVITEAKQAAGALMWAVEEMERRYSLIEQLNIRTIESYNERCAVDKSIGEPLPKIVIVIDELNDLMMQVRDPVEDLIMRIAQKARAAGIHLIIGTQRPDVKVVTGTIKANINTRISCKVTSVVDSRTILEMAGAEKLLNKGDMLFKPVDKTKPIRVQGCFVSDPEVEAIMNFLKSEVTGDQYDEEIFAEINKAAQKCGNKKSSGGMDEDMSDDGGECGYYNDQQFLDAVELAIRSGKVSTSLLQRKLSIGYGKAAKFIDAMEEIGIVSAQNGQKPRDVLLSMDEWHEKLTRVNFD